jgi:hypothetical protein
MPNITFSELTANCTAKERDELAWFLAMHRARKTWEALRSPAREVSMDAIAGVNTAETDAASSPLEASFQSASIPSAFSPHG